MKELIHRSWRKVTYLTVPHGFLSLFITEPGAVILGVVPSSMGKIEIIFEGMIFLISLDSVCSRYMDSLMIY